MFSSPPSTASISRRPPGLADDGLALAPGLVGLRATNAGNGAAATVSSAGSLSAGSGLCPGTNHCPRLSSHFAYRWKAQHIMVGAGFQCGRDFGFSSLFTSDGSGVQDGWVEVQFMDSDNNILADYKSAILSPIDATQPGSAGVQTINVNNLPTTTSVIPNQGGGTTLYTYLTWLDCPVKYQYDISTIGANTDPATESVTNVVASGVHDRTG